MNTREFFEKLLPPTGVIFTATPNTNSPGWANTEHDSIDQAVHHTNSLTFQNKPAYFALATYRDKRVWNPDWTDKSGKKVGKWQQRTQDNAGWLRAFFLDLDVDPADPDKKFASKVEALAELTGFVKKVGLPVPMLVDSGGGIHAYWPLHHAITVDEWKPVAELFKSVCLAEHFKADRSLTSDQARVLRALGGFNARRGHKVELLSDAGPYAFADFKQRLDDYAETNQVAATPARTPRAFPGAPVSDLDALGDNLGATNDPLHLDRIAFSCVQIGTQVGARGAGVGEKLWRAGLGIAKFCEPTQEAYRAISDGHAEYDEQATIIKISNWRAGPSTCEHFHTENPLTCESCPHWQKITSPAQLGRMVREAAPIAAITIVDETTGDVTEIKAPPLPRGYTRRKDGAVVMETEDREGQVSYTVVTPIDLYPLRILRQSGEDATIDEHSIWRAHLPRMGAVDMDLTHATMGDAKALHKFLLSRGVYMTGEEAKATQQYMTAYLQTLAAQADREKLYERMGWHDNRTAFVMGDRVMHRDGTISTHTASSRIRAATKDSTKAVGTLDGWKQAMAFYNKVGYEGPRMFVYASLGAPLFHMNDTGNKGVLMTASGESGRGKTTCLKACASMWGAPEDFIINGNKDGSTINGLYEALGTYHSMPFLWDDITEREPEEIRRVLLNISQGVGKIRMKDGGQLSERRVTWETIVLASANTDDVTRIMQSGKDVDPHLMRLVGVEFKPIDVGVEAKTQADSFLRAINRNHGHAGPIFMRAVMQNYDSVCRGFIHNVVKVDRLLGSSNASAERYWSAVVAAAYTAGQLASKLGLLPGYPVESDLLWMIDHMQQQRVSISEGRSTSRELLAEFLETHIGNTLILSAKASSNLDNVVLKPYHTLSIRHNLDSASMWIARAAVMEYCADVKTSFRKLEQELEAQGIIVKRNVLKVLGADTVYAKGQTRCWEIAAAKLGPAVVQTAAAAPGPSNVVPIGSKAA